MSRPRADVGPGQAIEDYLVTIYRLSVGGEAVMGTRLADQLGVAPATVTETTRRLRSAGLLEPGRGIVLSEEGMRRARALVSRHRLAERLLVDVLGFGWDEVHEEAHRLEHAFSARVTERLAAFLGHPATCPHGHPIMEDGAVEPDLRLVPLTALPAAAGGVVRRIAHEEAPLLALLTSLGIGLGTAVGVEAADGDVLTVLVGDRRQRIDRASAEAVLVEAGAAAAGGPAAGRPEA